MNQVYFYHNANVQVTVWNIGVLIPLWIRSIFTRGQDAVYRNQGAVVLIPLWIRSIFTAYLLGTQGKQALCLNPFMNQVYFYSLSHIESGVRVACLNPFMNQVYFYPMLPQTFPSRRFDGLNPFMNQVYFYDWTINLHRRIVCLCLNPFMNQVYFYLWNLRQSVLFHHLS